MNETTNINDKRMFRLRTSRIPLPVQQREVLLSVQVEGFRDFKISQSAAIPFHCCDRYLVGI